jgi:hypothetical protein
LLSFTACPAWLQSLYQDILKYVPVALQAFGSILSLLAGAGVIPVPAGTVIAGIIAIVKAAFADLQTDVTNYENAPAAQKSTLLGKISTALAVVEGNLQEFWSDLQIPDPQLAETVEGLIGVILSALAGFATQLPTPTPTPALTAVLKKRATLPKLIAVPAKKYSVKGFKAAYNAKLPTTDAQYQIR